MKIDHEKFLLKYGVHPDQIKQKKKSWPKKYMSNETHSRPSGNISANGTKPIDNFGKFKSSTHVVAPICNKGAYQVCSLTDIKTIGKKI